MKVLVTGGAGFIGSHLVDSLIKQGFKVTVVDNLATGHKENLSRHAQFYKLDIRSPRIRELFKKINPDVVYHLAAQLNVLESLVDPVTDAEINIVASLNVLEAVRQLSVKKFLFASSGGAVYGESPVIPTPETQEANPISPYAEAKYTLERYLKFYSQHHGLPYIVFRLSNVYGPRQDSTGECGVVSIFINKLLKNQELPINGTGQQTRDLLYVADAVKALMLGLEKGRGIFNIGTSQEISVRDLAVLLGKVSEIVPKVSYTRGRGFGDLSRSVLDNSLAKRQLGWQPSFTLSQGLEETINWFKN